MEPLGQHPLDGLVGDVSHVRATVGEARGQLEVEVETADRQPGGAGRLGQRQADVAQPDDDEIEFHETFPLLRRPG